MTDDITKIQEAVDNTDSPTPEDVAIVDERGTGKKKWDDSITSGPGRVGKAFGFHTSQCGLSLQSDELFIADDGFKVTADDIVSSPRIGVDYAGEHAAWHYRFYLKGNKFVSRPNRNQKDG